MKYLMTNVGILTKHATTLAEFLYKQQTLVTGTLLANKKRCTHSPQEYQQVLLTTTEGMEAPNSSLNHVQQAHGRGGHTGSYRLTLRQAKDLSLSFGNTGWLTALILSAITTTALSQFEFMSTLF